MISLYLDEDVESKALVQSLRASQVDLITTWEANRLGCSDEDQLTWANALKLLTQQMSSEQMKGNLIFLSLTISQQSF